MKIDDIAQSGTELRTRVIGEGGREEGGREEGALTHLERKGTPVVYLLLTQMVPLLHTWLKMLHLF